MQAKKMNPVDKTIHHVQEKSIVVKYNQLPDGIKRIKDFSLCEVCLITWNEYIVVQFSFKFL